MLSRTHPPIARRRVNASPPRSTPSSSSRSPRNTISTPLSQNSSASVRSAAPLARTNSISAMPIMRRKLLCLDAGHFHPTETIADKISSVLQFLPEILLHVSRGLRWDSDHVVTLTDDLQAIAREIVANGYLSRVHIGLESAARAVPRPHRRREHR